MHFLIRNNSSMARPIRRGLQDLARSDGVYSQWRTGILDAREEKTNQRADTDPSTDRSNLGRAMGLWAQSVDLEYRPNSESLRVRGFPDHPHLLCTVHESQHRTTNWSGRSIDGIAFPRLLLRTIKGRHCRKSRFDSRHSFW